MQSLEARAALTHRDPYRHNRKGAQYYCLPQSRVRAARLPESYGCCLKIRLKTAHLPRYEKIDLAV
eukprot:4932210-Pleurochrysis_carterae.AAC.4